MTQSLVVSFLRETRGERSPHQQTRRVLYLNFDILLRTRKHFFRYHLSESAKMRYGDAS